MPTRRNFLAAPAALAAAVPGAPAGRPAPVTSKKIRMAVVGGGFGREFGWHEHSGCVVNGVTDLRADRRKLLRDRYQCDAVYDSLEQMLERARDIDAVAIFSGAPDHCRHVEMCMRRGLDVISAVPAVISLEQAERLRDAKRSTGLRYMMAETSWFRQATIHARDLYRKGAFGELFYSELEYYHDGGERKQLALEPRSRLFEPDGSRSWRWGLPPMLYPTHSMGFLVGVTGERIRRVSCLGWGPDEPGRGDNAYKNPFVSQSSVMQTDRGHMARCNVFWAVAGIEERAQWFGSKGTFYMRNMDVHPDAWRSNELNAKMEPVAVPEYWRSDPMLPPGLRHASGHGGSHVFLAAEFVNALLEDREPVVDVYEALAMTVPGIVAHQSSLNNGEQMKVPDFGRRVR